MLSTQFQRLPTSLLLLSLLRPAWADTYTMIKEYAGPTFFNDWVFFDHFDNLTNGDVVFVGAALAASAKLAFVDPNTNHAIIKVDNTTTVAMEDKRNTVRISTADMYSVGSVWVADFFHVPFGCSVWPAWWSQAPGWPVGGEIDTFEGVNLQANNRISLHTLPGCMQVDPVQSSQMIVSQDCSNLTDHNQGCVTEDPRPQSFGAPFAQNGGGVFVTEYAATGISIWFFTRDQVPAVFTSNSSALDTSTLGLPVANYPSNTGCEFDKFFGPQQLILDITLCGDFAGDPATFNQTCSGVCYPSFVVGDGSDYANAFFEIGSIRVFSKDATSSAMMGPSNGSSSSSSGTGSSSGGSGSSTGPASGSVSGGSSTTTTGKATRTDPIGVLANTVALIAVVMALDVLLSFVA